MSTNISKDYSSSIIRVRDEGSTFLWNVTSQTTRRHLQKIVIRCDDVSESRVFWDVMHCSLWIDSVVSEEPGVSILGIEDWGSRFLQNVSNMAYPWFVAGPAFWGLINPEWSLCNKGRRQSPVNLEPNKLLFDPNLRPLHIDKHRVSLTQLRDTFNSITY
jgi:hypothetical protein